MEQRTEKKAYLYKVVNGELAAYEGMVRISIGDVGVFHTADGSGPSRRCQVSAREGEVRNNAVWMHEKDDSAAAAAFVRWADEKMKVYEVKLWKLRELSRNMYTMINEAKGKGNQ